MIQQFDKKAYEIIQYYEKIVGDKIVAKMDSRGISRQRAAQELFVRRIFESISSAENYVSHVRKGNIRGDLVENRGYLREDFAGNRNYWVAGTRLETFLEIIKVPENNPIRDTISLLDRLLLEYNSKRESRTRMNIALPPDAAEESREIA